jgi:hypothetical protein
MVYSWLNVILPAPGSPENFAESFNFKENAAHRLVSVKIGAPTNWGTTPILLPLVVDFKKIL